jgi:hypothetical protein
MFDLPGTDQPSLAGDACPYALLSTSHRVSAELLFWWFPIRSWESARPRMDACSGRGPDDASQKNLALPILAKKYE